MTVDSITESHGFPIILVDDGSDFECAEVLRVINAQVESVMLLRLPDNLGKGGAVKAGIYLAEEIGFSHALQLDADGQHDIGDIDLFLSIARDHPEDLVLGCPLFDDSIPKNRYYARYLTHVWVWINTLSFQVKDSMCGFRVYPLHQMRTLLDRHTLGNRMEFDVEIVVRWCWRGLGVRNVETKVSYPRDGISHFQGFKDNLLIACMHTKLFFLMLFQLPALIWKKFR
tara:strand:+ start:5401 stop:6084 length:684 start_codon:yes stop_codon:yes gene_type:complete